MLAITFEGYISHHGCQVELRFEIELAFMNSGIQAQLEVMDLNCLAVRRTLPAHEFRPLRSLANARTHSLADAQTLVGALRNRDARETFWLSAATHLHGVCPTDLPGRLARHRDLPSCQARSPVSTQVQRIGGARPWSKPMSSATGDCGRIWPRD